MSNAPARTRDRAGTDRPGPRRVLPLIAVLLAVAACTSHPAGPRDPAADTVRSLGAVPIPSPPSAQATPLADENHLQLLAMGAPVRAVLPEASAVVVASGPVEDLPSAGRMPARVTGTITVTVSGSTAPLTVTAADFTARDEQGTAVALIPVGAHAVTTTSAGTASLVLTGTFGSGAAQLTWRHHGRVVAIWDFNIELD